MSDYFNTLKNVAPDICSVLKALSHPNRLLLLAAIGDEEMAVSELEDKTGVRQPLLSRELARLREESLVDTRRESKSIYYKLSNKIAPHLLDALSAVWTGNPVPMSNHHKNTDFDGVPFTSTALTAGRVRIKPDPYRTDS